MAQGWQKPKVRARSAKAVRNRVAQIAIVLAALLVLAAEWMLVLWLLWRSWSAPI
jgi:hypothetical protein